MPGCSVGMGSPGQGKGEKEAWGERVATGIFRDGARQATRLDGSASLSHLQVLSREGLRTFQGGRTRPLPRSPEGPSASTGELNGPKCKRRGGTTRSAQAEEPVCAAGSPSSFGQEFPAPPLNSRDCRGASRARESALRRFGSLRNRRGWRPRMLASTWKS